MHGKRLGVLITVAVLAGASGCYESPDVNFSEPGVYSGPHDPLVDLQRSERQQERLMDRFHLVQGDR